MSNFTYRYPAPSNLNYLWNFGSYAMVSLAIQIFTGLILAMYYLPSPDTAFESVEYVMRDLNYGWAVRYLHANGASFFFAIVYLHILRSLYFTSYSHPREPLWLSGVTILATMILVAFMGYVLPWGQMSFWAATVITNLPGAIPIVGPYVVTWLWGGFTVSGPTLGHFFGLHVALSFFLVALVLIHLSLLHQYGSNNPLGFEFRLDSMPLVPAYSTKDLLGFLPYLLSLSLALFFNPNYLGHPDNYVPANPLVTPSHIVPEWYFLVFYAVLRCIPSKFLGLLGLVLCLVALAILPFTGPQLHSRRSLQFRPFSACMFWLFVSEIVLLGWLGGQPVQTPYYELSQLLSFHALLYLILLRPAFDWLEVDSSRLSPFLSELYFQLFSIFRSVDEFLFRSILNAPLNPEGFVSLDL